MQIRDKVVLVTGASQGIGAATARAFAKRGAKLAVTARSKERLRALDVADAFVTAGDLLEAADRRRIVESTLAHYGRIDVLVNNAGIGTYARAYDAPMDQVRRLFELNVLRHPRNGAAGQPRACGSGGAEPSSTSVRSSAK